MVDLNIKKSIYVEISRICKGTFSPLIMRACSESGVSRRPRRRQTGQWQTCLRR